MNIRIASLLVIAALVSCFFGSAQSLAENVFTAENAYITNEGDNTVSVIDTKTDKVIRTIPVGSEPYGVAASRDGRKVYVANSASNTVSVINTATNKVRATIPVGTGPFGVAVTPDGSKAYVSNLDANTVSVINTATNMVTATIPVSATPLPLPPTTPAPFGVAVSRDGSKVYVTNSEPAFQPAISVIDTATDTVTARIPSGLHFGGVAVSPDGSKVYFIEYEGCGVFVADTATNAVVAEFGAGEPPCFGLALSPDGSILYVANFNTVSVIATATNALIATIPVGSGPVGVAVTPDGRKIYVANSESNTVSVISAATDKVTATIPVGKSPAAFGIFIQPAPRFAGIPGRTNCYGESVSELARQYGGLHTAAGALDFSSVRALETAILAFCWR
jgi:YVTN family beta-propeller protein